jgi:hypothetical protein
MFLKSQKAKFVSRASSVQCATHQLSLATTAGSKFAHKRAIGLKNLEDGTRRKPPEGCDNEHKEIKRFARDELT